MSKTQIQIYATSEDLCHLLANVSSQRFLKLVKMGLFAASTLEILEDLGKLESLATYLIVEDTSTVTTRIVRQRNGDTRFAVDQLDNADSIVLSTGGMASDGRLVAGQIGTVRTEQAAQKLHALFAKEIAKHFVKIKSYYVGPQAAHLLDAGRRLSPTSKSPQEYDLSR